MRLAHISDTHIGYEAYRPVSVRGENQRGEDIVAAFHRACADIDTWDPPLVVHSGDMAERSKIPVRHMLAIRASLSRLASVRPDGTRRQVVVIAGNHDAPAHRREPCYLELFSTIPGVHIVTREVTTIEFSGVEDASDELVDVAVTAVAHDTLKELALDERFDDVQPVDGKRNVLVAHGVAGGSLLYKRTLGREYTIPTEVLGRDWDYVALGHWHRRGPVSTSGATNVNASRAWYAGSTENMGFGDVIDNGQNRGWLEVHLADDGAMPNIVTRNVAIRTMFRLPVVDGEGKSPGDIQQAIIDNIAAARGSGRLTGSVVGQVVTNTPRDIWALVDTARIRSEASTALHFDLAAEPYRKQNTPDDSQQAGERIGGKEAIDQAIREAGETVLASVDGEIKQQVLALATSHVAQHLKTVSDDGEG